MLDEGAQDGQCKSLLVGMSVFLGAIFMRWRRVASEML